MCRKATGFLLEIKNPRPHGTWLAKLSAWAARGKKRSCPTDGRAGGVSPMALALSGRALAVHVAQRSTGMAGSRDSFKVWACRDTSPVRHHSVFEAWFKRERL